MAHNTFNIKTPGDGQQALHQISLLYPKISAVRLYASTSPDGVRMLPSSARSVDIVHGCNKSNNSETLEPEDVENALICYNITKTYDLVQNENWWNPHFKNNIFEISDINTSISDLSIERRKFGNFEITSILKFQNVRRKKSK